MDWPADVRPAELRQPDGYSCGATAVVAARILLEPGWRPEDPAREILRSHRRLTSSTDAAGRSQLPWPRQLGTPPWSVARELAQLTGRPVEVRLARWSAEASYDELLRRLATRPVAVYIGDGWLPRHVVLAIDATDDGGTVRIFDPAAGCLVSVARGRWTEHRVDVARWTHLWFVV